jgi:hypothetical protein
MSISCLSPKEGAMRRAGRARQGNSLVTRAGVSYNFAAGSTADNHQFNLLPAPRNYGFA